MNFIQNLNQLVHENERLDISSEVFIHRQGKRNLSSQEPEIKNAMSQKAHTQLILPEPSEELIASEPWSIETYADGLMDELFADIDLILDGRDHLPLQTALSQESIRHVQTVTVPQIIVPETQIQPIKKVPKARNNPLSTLVVETPAGRAVSKVPQKSQRTNNSVLLWMGITIGLATACFLWVLNSGLLDRLVSKSLQQSLLKPEIPPQLPTKNQIESDLVNYILGALAVIDKQEAKSNLRSAQPVLTATTPANQTALAYITPQSASSLPAPMAVNNMTPRSSHPTTVVERVYIPVYQAPQPMRYTPPSIAGMVPTATMPKNSLGNAYKPIPEKVAIHKEVQALVAVRPELKPVAVSKPVNVQQAPQPPLPVVPSNVSAKVVTASSRAPEPQEVATTVTIPEVAAESHTLEGLLELGNKSAALFKISGVSHRVEVGEAIGSSGWILVNVANGEAMIRRNGEVRSIFTGQTF